MAPSIHQFGALQAKFGNEDSDIRYMSLVDLLNYLEATPLGPASFVAKDFRENAALVDKILVLLDDTNGDVQGQALKCVGPLAIRSSSEVLPIFLEKVTRTDVTRSGDKSIPSTASRYFVTALPRPVPGIPSAAPVQLAYEAISTVMIPRLVGRLVLPLKGPVTDSHPKPPPGMLEIDPQMGVNVDAIDLLNETVRCFGPLLQPEEIEALIGKLWEILESQQVHNIGKKKAVAGLSILAVYLSDEGLSKFISTTIESLRASHLPASQRRVLVALLGSLSRTIPRRFGVYLKTIAEFVLQALSKEEYDELLEARDEDGSVDIHVEEVKEVALIVLEDFVSSCVNEMRPFTDEALDSSLRYLGYDPTRIEDSDDEMDGAQGSDVGAEDNNEEEEEDDFEGEEDFEAEEGLDDDDDTSWKVRRCAAKSLQALIQTRLNDLMEGGILYDKIAPFLVKRFGEREENVRLEILSIMAFIIKKTSETSPETTVTSSEQPIVEVTRAENSRKRPRERSDASMFDEPYARDVDSPGQTPSPVTGPRADISRLGPSIVQGLVKVFSQKSVPTKQAAIVLLKEFANLKHGGLSEHLGQIIEPVVGIAKASGGIAGGSAVVSSGGAASATANSLRMESLDFLKTLCDTHSSKVIAPYVSSMVAAVVSASDDKYFKVSCNAIDTAEAIIKVLTPPRFLGSDQKSSSHISAIYSALSKRVKANDTDLEVRLRAIHAIGVCLMRTSGNSQLLSSADRGEALTLLEDRLKNETTRIVSIEAIDGVAASATATDLTETWTHSIVDELSNQLRKANLRLRVASLGALRRMVANSHILDCFDSRTTETITGNLLPLLNVANLGTLGLALSILTGLVKRFANKVVTPDLTDALCGVVTSTMSGPTLDTFLALVSIVGAEGQGKPLMDDLLNKASLKADPIIVGAAIGTLIVSGDTSVGVGQKEILKELESAIDNQRRCLALCILGEVGLRQGTASTLKPQTFLDYFESKSEQVRRIAAVSLGRAGAGNMPLYLPVVVETLQKSTKQSLLLHSVKELLQQPKMLREHPGSLDTLWKQILEIASSEDNKAIGAECLGRLVVIEPSKYLASLKAGLARFGLTSANLDVDTT